MEDPFPPATASPEENTDSINLLPGADVPDDTALDNSDDHHDGVELPMDADVTFVTAVEGSDDDQDRHVLAHNAGDCVATPIKDRFSEGSSESSFFAILRG